LTSDPETLAELKRITRLLSLLATKDLETQREKISLLASAGLEARDIAELLGTTRNTVSVAMSEMRRASGERTNKKAGPHRGEQQSQEGD
jgi:CRP-like cAMP-binding protein